MRASLPSRNLCSSQCRGEQLVGLGTFEIQARIGLVNNGRMAHTTCTQTVHVVVTEVPYARTTCAFIFNACVENEIAMQGQSKQVNYTLDGSFSRTACDKLFYTQRSKVRGSLIPFVEMWHTLLCLPSFCLCFLSPMHTCLPLCSLLCMSQQLGSDVERQGILVCPSPLSYACLNNLVARQKGKVYSSAPLFLHSMSLQGPPVNADPSTVSPDQGTADQEGQGNQQYLHRSGSPGQHVGPVHHLPRTRGPQRYRLSHSQEYSCSG